MSKSQGSRANDDVREAWDRNAAFWDRNMGEGNDFFELLAWPPTERLLGLSADERVLDVACGNGLTSRRMAATGADVVAIDFSSEMLVHARRRTPAKQHRLEYSLVDATDFDALVNLGRGSFHAAVCSMALFDMADIDPLMRAVAELLRPGGRFVFSVLHPCFNNPHTVHVGELQDTGSEFKTVYSVKIPAYLTSSRTPGIAMPGQPVPHIYFHRPLEKLLGAGFAAGLVLDALEERAFAPDRPSGSYPLSWGGNFSEIPPVLVARMKPARRR